MANCGVVSLTTSITIDSRIRIKDPPEELIQFVKKEYVVKNPEYAQKQRLGLWLGNTPKDISFYRVLGNTLELPYGTLAHVYPYVLDADYKDCTEPKHHVNYKGSIKLYDYQERAVNAVLERFNYGIIQAPAGSGKTTLALELVSRLGYRALWLTHTKDLLNQSKRRYEQFFDKDLVGTITEGKVKLGKGITFATVQTMVNVDLTDIEDYFDVVIVDEVHRVSGSPTTLTQFYEVLGKLNARHKYGLSATVHRADGMIKATFSIIGDIVVSIDEDAVADKIMPVGVKRVDTQTRMTRDALNTDGTMNYQKLIKLLVEDNERNKLIVDSLIHEKGHSCLVLSDRINHLSTLKDLLPDHIKDTAVMVTGSTKKSEREQALDDMRSGKKKILFASYRLAKEGLDIPRLSRLFLVSPQKDYAIVTQSIGRIARTFEGKENAIAYDFVDTNIRYLERAFRKRVSHYKKAKAYEI